MGYALALSSSFELIYYLKNLSESKKKQTSDDAEVEVIFFPDTTMACEAHFTYGCNNNACWLSHEPTSTMKVVSFVKRATKTLDICVYCIASQTLVESVLEAQHQGVIVRVITDQAQAVDQQHSMEKLRAAGQYVLILYVLKNVS